MTETDSQPIAENEQVKELLALLKDNNTPGYEEFAKLIEHVTGMEQRLSEATKELKAVRQEMQGLQNHSLKDALQKSCKAMETNISVMRHRLSELKGQMINGCRNILADFRERGTVALNGITQFLHVRPVLESIQSAAEKSMQASNRAVARIDAFSTEYHEMGRHLKNMGRAIQGKPAETNAKENGKVARVFKGAFKVEGALISSINRNAEWALNTLARLEQTAERHPSVLEAMREQAAKTEPAKKQPAPSHDKESRYHYSTMFRQWMDQAFRYMPQDLEERLNMQYMEAAQNPDMDKYRIPQGTAKQMLLYDEAPVYRLLPSGSEKIAPIAAVSTGLWYENYREFAIAPEDLDALDKLIRRETDRLTGNLPQLHKNEERRPAPER